MAEIKNGKLTLKIATFNIAAGRYNRDLSGICEDIKASGADIVGLQEVDMFTERSGKIDMLAQISERTAYPYSAFVHAIDYDGGEYGTAIMSRYPMTRVEILPLESADPKFEDRSVGIAEIDVLGEKIAFLNTHISYESPAARALQFEHLAHIISGFESYIITGDFNTDDFSNFARFYDSVIVNNNGNYLPSFSPESVGIDNIVASSDWSYHDPKLGREGSSDHRLLSCVLER